MKMISKRQPRDSQNVFYLTGRQPVAWVQSYSSFSSLEIRQSCLLETSIDYKSWHSTSCVTDVVSVKWTCCSYTMKMYRRICDKQMSYLRRSGWHWLLPQCYIYITCHGNCFGECVKRPQVKKKQDSPLLPITSHAHVVQASFNANSAVNVNETSCRWAAATICPAPLLPLWAPKRLAPPSRPRLQTAT